MPKQPEKQPSMSEVLSFIEECASLEGTEMGDAWRSLLKLYHRRDFVGKTMQKALEKELISTFKYLKKHSKIETRPEVTTRTVKTLVFDNE